ncbi:DNA-directed DNA polymerase [Malassezia japonica]|uniref:Mitochondrial DNA polymerase catalytic subunit n=1 Tax=Malassezia japonica TaxID=223818 RepID=A0AAF0F5Q8_9BASI|nr:DNA-directed DNA polymerase [Malassezia japonica]WFD38947.1 DNA-directed DNA polymerase [Malassezia japonica]
MGRMGLRTQAQSYRVFVLNVQRYTVVSLPEEAMIRQMLQATVSQMHLAPCADRVNGWAVFDVLPDLGIGFFLVKTTEWPTLLRPEHTPSYSATLGGWVSIQSEPRKWTKKWLELREHALFTASSESPYGFALRRQGTSLDTDRTVAYVTQPDAAAHRDWVKAIVGAHTYILRQESPDLFVGIRAIPPVSFHPPRDPSPPARRHTPNEPPPQPRRVRSNRHLQHAQTSNAPVGAPLIPSDSLSVRFQKGSLLAARERTRGHIKATFQLPPLQGKDLGEHFWTIGRRAAQPWLGYAETFATKRLPSPPVPRVEDLGDDSVWWSAKNWLDLDPSLRLGDPESVPYPDVKESALVFDVEVLMTESQFPVMATARSETAEHLIPMGPRNGSAPPRLIISHNAGFDRAAVLDEYTLHSSSIRWLDTMSLHVATSGISSPQRAEWVMHSRKRAERKLKKLLAAEMVEDDAKELIRALLNDGELDADALARLDVHKLDGWADEVKSSMEDHLALMEASLDVHDESSLASDSVEEKSSVLWQDVTSRNSLAEVAALHCNIEMDKEARNKFIDGTPREQIREECAALLAYCANDVATTHSVFCKVWPAFVERCPHPATIAGVLALGSTFLPVDEAWLDYQAKANAKFDEMNVAVVAALKNLTYVLKDSGVCDIDAYNGNPERVQPWWKTDPWYAQLDWTPKRPKKGALPVDQLVPKWTRGKYEDPKTKLNSRIAMVIPLLRLRVDGDIVLRDDRRWVSFLPYFESNRLKSLHPNESGEQAAKGAVEMNAMCSYWISVRDRVEKQMVVWDGKAKTSMGFDSDTQRGLILPHVISMGTVTRRAIEKTWLTASNAKPNRIGSELKAMVRAPPGWCIVGADVDSEELWICSVMGDAQFGVHGATAIGWMTLEGSKSQGTDLHSKTASILGTSRNQAKVFNYSRIYGAGIKHATQLLLKANPSMPLAEATHRAKQLYAATKGNTVRSTNLFGRRFWYGGTESFVFNKLEEIATSDTPRTPALDCGITAALSKKHLPDAAGGNQDYMPSRINWVVQSSGVDYLHMLVAAMDHLCTTYQISARFMLSVHDEVRYLAKEEDKHRTALALQIANLWTRAMFAYKLNMSDLPETCAWFAEVDIDHVLRKEAASDINEVRALARRTSPNASKLSGSLAEAFHAHQANRPTRKGRRSMHTSAKPCSRFSDYYAMLPPRPVRIRQPMYKHPEYRAYVLHLYRKLLRAVYRLQPAVRESLFPLLRTQMRHNKRITSRAQIWHWCASGKMLLEHLQTCADPASQRAIEASMEKMQALADRLASRRPPAPAPKQYHLTGALLPPTLFNPPMLRYKPDQPESMTMMIRDRRRRRERRMQQWSNVQEMAQLAKDECASLGGHEPVGNAGEWTAPLVDAERDMQAQFQREYARARMVFDRETLRRAKAAKHAKRVQNSARTRQPVPDK